MNEYLSLFSGNIREKQRFMALASVVLGQVADLQAVVGEINGAFSPETAQGAQLDALGASLGLSRAETSAGVTASDAVFRDYIRKKLIRWGWDGTNRTVQELAEKIKPGAAETDNQNGTVTVTGAGSQPAAVKELFPVPAGIRTT